MEKELEALERLKTAPSFMGGTVEYRLSSNSQATLLEDYELVKQALTELKSIKEANPSEALRKLDTIRHLEIGFDKNKKPITLNDTSGLNIIEKALTTKSKKEQAFEIIKKYAVNDGWSNGWVIKFWDMNSEELDLVNEVLK